MKIDVERLKQFFFDAALATYASGKKAERVRGREWEREFFFSSQRAVQRDDMDDLVYIDRYAVNGEWSGGQTVILAGGKPVWLMQYQGWCRNDNKAVLDFLKLALKSAYERKKFVGGRGPERFESTNLEYFNSVNLGLPEDAFVNFSGNERILLGDGTVVFWHRYQGHLLGKA